MKTSRFPLVAAFAAAALLASLPAHATDGEVKKIDRAQAKVTIAHGEIKNLGMPAMTMTYRAKPANLLEGVAVGDRVQFSADKVDGQYVVTTLEKKR
jgi:Cu(I)/Ag(I) efflux system periplasmic protein CusF